MATPLLREHRSDIARALGRPRRALFVGSARGADVVTERGGEAVIVANGVLPSSGGPFDTVVLGGLLNGGDEPRAAVERVVPLLEDGGHLVVDLARRAPHAREIESLLAKVGLEPLHVERDPMLAYLGGSAAAGLADSAAVVARVPPKRKRLSLTVGMISMNEEGAVGAVIDDIRKHVPAAEILLVDSSKDATPQIAESQGARVVRQFPPKGYGPAMHRLLYETLTDVIITMDCDGTYPSDRIAQLFELVENGADLVNATRTHHRPKAMPLPNYIANRVFAGAAQVLHGLPTTDVHSGMRAYRTSMLRGITVDQYGPALPVELYVVPARLGYRMVEVEIPYFERVGASTLQRFDSTFWTFKRLLRAREGARVKRGRVELL
jgi:hypothetical protein